jgi:hypothetical protein
VSRTIGCGKGRVTRRGTCAQGRLALTLTLAALLPSAACAITTAPTIANNTFASTPVGQSLTQTVTLTLTSATAIKSIALATGTSDSSEYTLKSITDCIVDGTTVNASGTVCDLSVKYTPLSPGSLASPTLSRNAQLLYTDGASNVTAYGLSGAATKAIGHVVPGTISLYAGLPYTAAGQSPLNNGLGQVNGGYAGNGVAATAATFQFNTYNTILAENVPSNGSQPLAFDSQGNLYVIDGPNFVIRKIDNSSSHIVTTIAGTPSKQGYTGDGGAATSAKLNNPRGLTLDAAGNIYFLDQTLNQFYVYPAYVIRRIDAVTGIITAIAGENFTGTYGGGGICDLTNTSAYAVYQCGDGGLATEAFLNAPNNLALDSAGNFYIWGGSYGNPPYVREITASTGIISTIGNETNLNSTEVYGGMTLASDGNVYVLAIDKTANKVEIKQLDPATQVVTTVAGSASAYTGCGLPAAQQIGFPAANLGLATGIQASLGDLSSDASGNLYVDDDLCTNGAVSIYDFPPSIVRINIASATAYDEVVANAYPYGGTQTIGYNAFYFYGIYPVSPIADNAGNIFFTSWNQIAELSGQNAELDYTERYDYTTSAAQIATYANVGNASGIAPTYSFHTDTNFVILDSGDTNACDVRTSVAEGGTCDLNLAFSPVAVGPLTDTLDVSGSGSAETVTVDGIGDAAALLSISPASLDFGNQPVDVASAFKTFTLTDTGTANLTIESFFPDGTNGFANYEVVANGGTCNTSSSTVLTPNTSCTVEITFTPSVPGSLPATFYVNTSVSFGDVATLTGSGGAAMTALPVANLQFTPAILNLVAGDFSQGYTGDGGPATKAELAGPSGIAYDATGNLYIADRNNTVVRKVDIAGNITTFAGNGTQGYTGDGGPATSAELNRPEGVAVDANGNVYISDENANVIRKVDTSGTITTFAGTGAVGYSGDSGPATSAKLNDPIGIAFDPAGNLYIADTPNNVIRKVDTSGKITTFAGNHTQGYTGDGGPAISAQLNAPTGVASDAAGNVYIADEHNYVYRKVDTTGKITTIAGTGSQGAEITCGNGDAPTKCAFSYGQDVYVSPGGDIYLADSEEAVFLIDKAGLITIVNQHQQGLGAGIIGNIDTVYGTPAVGFVTGDKNGNILFSDYSGVVTSAGTTGGLDFPVQDVYTTSPVQYLTLVNPGAATLTFSGTPAITGPYAISGGTCNLSAGLAASASCTLGVTYSPTADGSTPGTIVLDTNATTSPSTVKLSGTGQGAPTLTATLDPTSLTFTTTTGTTSAAQTAIFTNTGPAPITISNITVTADSGFNESDDCGTSLAAGKVCTISVTFSPNQPTTFSGQVLISSDATTTNNGRVSLSGTGTPGAAPTVSLAPSSLTFSSPANTPSAAQTVTLKNTGTSSLTGIAVSLTGPNPTEFVKTTTCGTSLNAGASCTISVTFTPASATTYTASISVADDATGSPQTVALSGTGTPAPAPVASLSPTTISFPNTSVGSTATAMSTTLSNTGNAVLNISGITLSGANTSDFAETTSCGTTLAAGKTCTISATFTPASAASFTTTISVTDDATGSPQTVTLTGTGTAAPIVSLSPTTLSFPNTPVGSTATAMSTTVRNTGNAALTLSGVTLAGSNSTDFAQTNNCGASLAASASCTISVTFTPAAVANYAATISVADNAAGSPQIVTLTGEGTAAPAPVASLSPAALSFPATTAGTASAALITTLSNTGNAVLNISGITLAGTNPGDFADTTSCGATLAAGSNCKISITFTPAAAANYTATLSVADNAAGSPQTAALSGTGVAPAAPVASLSPASLTFAGTVTGTTTAAQTLTLSNTGGAELTISGVTVGGTNPVDFAETTTCGTTLAAGAHCTIAVTFTPASLGNFTATISVADNAADSPQTSTLAGTGVAPPDFTVTSSVPSQTIEPGGTAPYPMIVAATGGDFTGPVTLTATGLPPGATATFAPSSVSPGSESASSVLTVQTGGNQAQVKGRWPWAPITAVAFCVPLLWWRKRKRGRLLCAGVLCALLSVTAMSATGCGGGYYLNTSKTYTVTVSGTSGSSQHSTTVTLIIE